MAELPAHLHALMNALVCVCRGRAGGLTLTRCTSLGKMVGRTARTVPRRLGAIAGTGLIVTGQTRGGVRWVALTRAAVSEAGGGRRSRSR